MAIEDLTTAELTAALIQALTARALLVAPPARLHGSLCPFCGERPVEFASMVGGTWMDRDHEAHTLSACKPCYLQQRRVLYGESRDG